MANVSFLNLDRSFSILGADAVAFSSFSGGILGSDYSFITTGGDDWEMFGDNITDDGTVPTGGTVTRLGVDLDNENDLILEIDITNIGNVDATSFGINVGTAVEQRDAFWAAALQGNDTIDFTLADFNINLEFAGDGASINDGGVYLGGDDSLLDGGSFMSGNTNHIAGDFIDVIDGVLIGGNDLITVSSYWLSGDSETVGANGVVLGGDDTIMPVAMSGGIGGYIAGDVWNGNGGVTDGGNDLIDLRNTDFTGFTSFMRISGDVTQTQSDDAVQGGNDTIYGSQFGDQIDGEVFGSTLGTISGGHDVLDGRGGDDTINGDTGNDDIDGGIGNDSLNGGTGADTIFGNDDDDIIQGENGADDLSGGKGSDNIVAGDGNDSVKGNNGADDIEGGAGSDTLKGDGGEDTITGGGGADEIFGNDLDDRLNGSGGNDTLTGGKGSDRLDGGSDNDRLVGGNGSDTLIGGGGNDTLVGDGGSDTFVFGVGKGNDQINDFEFAGGDKIDVSDFGAAFDTFGEVLNEMTQDGNDVVINFGGGDTMRIVDSQIGDFSAGDFIFS